MKITCSNCSKQLKISTKIQKSLEQLGAGRVLRLNCPKCKEAIALDASHLPARSHHREIIVGSTITPPTPPDIQWLKDGVFEEEEVVEDIPQTLILSKPGPERAVGWAAATARWAVSPFANGGIEIG